jgi:hypothetical protein
MDLQVFTTGPLAGLALKTELTPSQFYEAYSEAAKRKDHDLPAATLIGDPNDPGDAALCEVARAVEHNVFSGMDEETRAGLDAKLGPREPRTHFVLGVDYRDDPAMPMPGTMLRLDNTVLAPTAKELAESHPKMPPGFISVEDMYKWGVNIDETLEASGVPWLRNSDRMMDVVMIASMGQPGQLYHSFIQNKLGLKPKDNDVKLPVALYREVVQLQDAGMVTILNDPGHRRIQQFGYPWRNYEGITESIRYTPGDKYASRPYYSLKAEYVDRLERKEPNGADMIRLLFDPNGGPHNVHIGSAALLLA